MMAATIEGDERGLRVPDKTTLMSLGATQWPRDPGGCAKRRAIMNASSVLAVCHGENHLLAAIPPLELARWKSRLESVEMPLGAVLHGAGRTPPHVYFPTSAIVALMYVTEQGASAEVALIGNEGLVGIAHFFGGQSMPSQAVVQCAGRGFRVSAHTIKCEFDRSGPVLRLLLRYAQALLTQIGQKAVCNRHHSPDQQLSCLLLRSLDRVQGSALVLTQELVAHMLGLRRESVTAAALRLQKAGLIQYARGHISVLNRTGLERSTCECYSVVRTEYDRLLPDTLAA
jgi:CRP-like cAMP-binding protein